LIPECLLIEPTETEDKQTLDDFIKALSEIQQEANENIETLKQAPYTLPVRRLDDVKAAKDLDIVWLSDE
jgi:glycine dehydrogenase subunit 2